MEDEGGDEEEENKRWYFSYKRLEFPHLDKISSINLRNPDAIVRGVGERLRRLRLAAGWTQVELAERAGVALSTLKLMERRGKGSLQRLAKVAVALNVDGELRGLFAEPRMFESLEAAERTERTRAPGRRKKEEER